jgi:hypothetical protein
MVVKLGLSPKEKNAERSTGEKSGRKKEKVT